MDAEGKKFFRADDREAIVYEGVEDFFVNLSILMDIINAN